MPRAPAPQSRLLNFDEQSQFSEAYTEGYPAGVTVIPSGRLAEVQGQGVANDDVMVQATDATVPSTSIPKTPENKSGSPEEIAESGNTEERDAAELGVGGLLLAIAEGQ